MCTRSQWTMSIVTSHNSGFRTFVTNMVLFRPSLFLSLFFVISKFSHRDYFVPNPGNVSDKLNLLTNFVSVLREFGKRYQNVLLSRKCGLGRSRKKRRFGHHQSQNRWNDSERQVLMLKLATLLLSGDIELNPGPSNVCPICSIFIFQFCRGVCCEICNQWYHPRCVGMSIDSYDDLKQQKVTKWQCFGCTQLTLRCKRKMSQRFM